MQIIFCKENKKSQKKHYPKCLFLPRHTKLNIWGGGNLLINNDLQLTQNLL